MLRNLDDSSLIQKKLRDDPWNQSLHFQVDSLDLLNRLTWLMAIMIHTQTDKAGQILRNPPEPFSRPGDEKKAKTVRFGKADDFSNIISDAIAEAGD